MRRTLPWLVLIALLGPSAPSSPAFTIAGPTHHRHSIELTGLPPHMLFAISVLNPDPVVHLGAAAQGGLLDTTFTADAAQHPGWTLNFGGHDLGGVLTINDYLARDRGNARGGATMDATYAPAAGDPAGLTFVQVFDTTSAGTHIDPFPSKRRYRNPLYYYSPELRQRWGLTFNDNPFDTAVCDTTLTARFDTYLVSFDRATRTVTAYDGWQWGYDLTAVCYHAPEPSALALAGVAALAGVGYGWRRRSTVG